MQAGIHKQSLGWQETAYTVFDRARACIPAYQRFLREHGVPNNALFEQLPIADKKSYVLTTHPGDFAISSEHEIFTFFRSSGSSGTSFLWPQLKGDYRWATKRMRAFLENAYAVNRRRTLALVCMGLGSWVGGDYYSWILKNVALDASYQLTIASPGDQHEEAIEIIHANSDNYEQVLVIICPSMLGYLRLLATTLGKPLPLRKLRFLVAGETFPEAIRLRLQALSSQDTSEPVMLSIYGSADTGALGSESPASVAMRQLLHHNPELNGELNLGTTSPNLFHFTGTDTYLETVNGDLCVTRWQGVPLIRYNLHDHTSLLSWSGLRSFALRACRMTNENRPLLNMIEQADELPDVIAVHGRSDSSLILGGTNFTESMLNEAIGSAALASMLTGAYRASVTEESDRAMMSLEIEFQESITPDQKQLDIIYPLLVEALSTVQPEFASDWQSVYRRWDHDLSRCVLRLKGYSWPELSRQDARLLKVQRLFKPTTNQEMR